MDHSKMSYSHDSDPVERYWMTRNMSYTYDFETHGNVCHKQSVLFHGQPWKKLMMVLFEFMHWNAEIMFKTMYVNMYDWI